MTATQPKGFCKETRPIWRAQKCHREPKAPPEIAVTYPGSAGTTNAGAAARPDPREIKVEKGRNGGSGRPSSTAFLRSELNVFPFKYKTQTREWLAEPPTTSSSSKATEPDPPVISISDRVIPKVFQREVLRPADL